MTYTRIVTLICVAAAGCDSKPVLQISAGKSATAFLVTNREARDIDRCIVRLLDAGDDEWVAEPSDTIKPSETIRIPWSAFQQRGQPVPSYVVQARKNFIVSCTDKDNNRLSAGVAF